MTDICCSRACLKASFAGRLASYSPESWLKSQTGVDQLIEQPPSIYGGCLVSLVSLGVNNVLYPVPFWHQIMQMTVFVGNGQ